MASASGRTSAEAEAWPPSTEKARSPVPATVVTRCSARYRAAIAGPARRHPRGDLYAGVEPQLAADLLDMALGSALRDEQPGCDLPVRQPLSDKVCNISHPAGETGRHHNESRRSIATRPGRRGIRNPYRIPVPVPVLLRMTASPRLPSLGVAALS